MRFPKRLKLVVYICCLFVGVNVLLYLKSEELSPPDNANRVERRQLLIKKNPTKVSFVTGLSSPQLFMDDVLQKFQLMDLFPSSLWAHNTSDRLLRQLDFLNALTRGLKEVPTSMVQLPRTNAHPSDKVIFVTSGVHLDPWQMKREIFINERCPINNCFLTDDSGSLPPGMTRPDAVVYKGAFNALKRLSANRTKDEVWVVYQLESPKHASMSKFQLKQYPNWTATYRTESTMGTPYKKFVSYPNADQYERDGEGFRSQNFDEYQDIASGKTKMVAWFVTNCRAENHRMKFIKDLQKYVDVDIFGSCGTLKCPKQDDSCYDMLKTDYKFYLAFENSNCREYITEKMFFNSIA